MRLQISHETTLTFETPVHYAVQAVRMTPRGSSQQFVNDWRIDVSADCRLAPIEDPYGNWTHTISVDGLLTEVTVVASGEIMTEETNGIIRGTPERLPLSVYLRQTELTFPTPEVTRFAASVHDRCHGDALSTMHQLMTAIHEAIEPGDERCAPPQKVKAAIETGKGTALDRAHLFVAAARELAIPARYVSGYVLKPGSDEPSPHVHSWAEAFISGNLGWIGFDPTENICPTDHHVRLATGLDYLDAQPIRAAGRGGYQPSMAVAITVREVASRRKREIVE
jgi:transglutaminase-like putative cysteine protease